MACTYSWNPISSNSFPYLVFQSITSPQFRALRDEPLCKSCIVIELCKQIYFTLLFHLASAMNDAI
jgi:hypothetical protein